MKINIEETRESMKWYGNYSIVQERLNILLDIWWWSKSNIWFYCKYTSIISFQHPKNMKKKHSGIEKLGIFSIVNWKKYEQRTFEYTHGRIEINIDEGEFTIFSFAQCDNDDIMLVFLRINRYLILQ